MASKFPLAIALSLGVVAAAQATEPEDHAAHTGHGMTAQAPASAASDEHSTHHPHPETTAASGQAMPMMDHSQMDHGGMNHERMQGTPSPEHPAGYLGAPVPPLTDADRAAAFPGLPPHAMHRGGINYLFLADRLEWQDANAGSALAWDLSGWVGGNLDRLAFRSEGERLDGHTEEAELQLLWSHAIGPWWETVAGVRQDFKPGSAQTWAAFGVQGMPLYGLETEATAFLGEGGQSAARLNAEYDILLTNRLILQPVAEANLYGRNDEERGVGSGLGDTQLGLRLRYEIRREFAPYIGVNWTRAYGNTADLLRDDGEDVSEARLVAGIRMWF